MNKYLQTIVIAPITSSSKPYPTRVEVNQSKTNGWVVLDQIRTIDKTRVINVLEKLSSDNVTKVKEIIMETYVR